MVPLRRKGCSLPMAVDIPSFQILATSGFYLSYWILKPPNLKFNIIMLTWVAHSRILLPSQKSFFERNDEALALVSVHGRNQRPQPWGQGWSSPKLHAVFRASCVIVGIMVLSSVPPNGSRPTWRAPGTGSWLMSSRSTMQFHYTDECLTVE